MATRSREFSSPDYVCWSAHAKVSGYDVRHYYEGGKVCMLIRKDGAVVRIIWGDTRTVQGHLKVSAEVMAFICGVMT